MQHQSIEMLHVFDRTLNFGYDNFFGVYGGQRTHCLVFRFGSSHLVAILKKYINMVFHDILRTINRTYLISVFVEKIKNVKVINKNK